MQGRLSTGYGSESPTLSLQQPLSAYQRLLRVAHVKDIHSCGEQGEVQLLRMLTACLHGFPEHLAPQRIEQGKLVDAGYEAFEADTQLAGRRIGRQAEDGPDVLVIQPVYHSGRCFENHFGSKALRIV